MKRCAYCGKENTDEATNCAECGTSEFRSTNSSPQSPDESGEEFVTVMKCATLPEADLIVSELEGAGIEAFIPDASLMQNFSLPAMFGFVRVQVAPKDYQAARDLLTAKEETSPDEPPLRSPPAQA